MQQHWNVRKHFRNIVRKFHRYKLKPVGRIVSEIRISIYASTNPHNDDDKEAF